MLAGPMGSGKTTLGRILARRLGRRFIDSDEQLYRSHRLTARELAARDGVPALHAAEVDAFTRALSTEEPAVIAAAAAVADSPEALAALAGSDATVVLLEGAISVLFDRLDQPSGHRRQMSQREFEQRTTRRSAALEALRPSAMVDTAATTPEESVDQIIDAIGAAAT